MEIKNVNFKNISPKTGDQKSSFEEICCQIAHNSSKYNIPQGSEAIRLMGEGGDGGIEFYWQLPSGEKWGWQAKYLFDFNKLKKQAEASFKTAIDLHPTISKYFICIPFDLTGNTKRGIGQRDKFNDYKKYLESYAKANGRNTEIILEQSSDLLDKLLEMDPSLGRVRFWFETNLLSDDWFDNHINSTVKTIPRYTPELKVETPLFQKLMSFTRSDGWETELKLIYKDLKEKVRRWGYAVNTKDDKSWGAKFPEDLINNGIQCLDKAKKVLETIERIVVNKEIPSDEFVLLTDIDESLKAIREISNEIKQRLEKEHGEGSTGSAHLRQWNAEWMVKFPMENYDAAKELIEQIENVKTWIKNGYIKLYNSRFLLLTGDWGVGKTFAICDLAELRRAKKQKTLFLFGDRFTSGTEPWIAIQNQIGFQFESKEALFASLEASAELSGSRLLICIDAINETEPKSYWKTRLRPLTIELEKYPQIDLCVSCRTSYKDLLLEECSCFTEVKHHGFVGIEYEAAFAFFTHFDLIPPTTPIIHPEFANPLFLRLICHTLTAKGEKQMPNGWQGINTVISAFLEEKNKAFGEQNGIDKRYRIPEKALTSFVQTCKNLQKSVLSWDEADKSINSVLNGIGANNFKRPLLDWLIDEHLLFIDAPPSSSDNKKEHIRISFERLGDHLLALSLLDGRNKEQLLKDFLIGGELNYLVSDLNSIETNKGILEALSIQIPEKYFLEFPDIVDSNVNVDILEITLSQLHWRDPSLITYNTEQQIASGLKKGKSYLVFDELVSCSFSPSKIDAYYLDDLLRRRRMTLRDPFWCGFLHSRYGLHKDLINKILERSLSTKPSQVSIDILKRWCTLLCWFCSAADRRIRDRATKALVNMTQNEPALWIDLFGQFNFIDDDYILERVLAATYGVLLRTRNKAVEREMAKAIDERIFSRTEYVLNAVIRDYARSIIELAIHDKAIKKPELKNPYKPPYKSDGKRYLIVPSDKELEVAKQKTDKTKLEGSIFNDDFFNYTLDSLSGFYDFMTKKDMASWILVYIANMGFNTEDFKNYEGYMLYNYGGGRGKPVWAERIGKKYQWITLFRLAGLLSDNFKSKKERWDQKPLINPLSFERGRQIDPSILCREPQTQAFYDDDLFGRYDFNSKNKMTDNEWINLTGDLPLFTQIQRDHGGEDYLLLDGHMEQSNRSEFDDEFRSKHRRFWILINSYLVKNNDAPQALKWLSTKNFMGKWMPEGPEYNDGFAGEYPWATLFNLYKDYYVSSWKNPEGEEFPCIFVPTSATLHSDEEYDSSGYGSFTAQVPTKIFFNKSKLKWNNIDGFTIGDQLVFVDPSVQSRRKGALLADKKYIQNFLQTNGYTLFWTVLAEKMISSDKYFIHQTFNQVHCLNDKSEITSTKPVIEIK